MKGDVERQGGEERIERSWRGGDRIITIGERRKRGEEMREERGEVR